MTTSDSKGRFFYKTNLFKSIRITNRIESIRIVNWNALLSRSVPSIDSIVYTSLSLLDWLSIDISAGANEQQRQESRKKDRERLVYLQSIIILPLVFVTCV